MIFSNPSTDAYVRLHTAILLAGGTGLFGRLISIGELPLVCIRVILAAMILLAIMWRGKHLCRLPWNHLSKIMGCGVLLAVHWVLFYGSIKAANVSIGAVCLALIGFFTALSEPILFHRRISWRELLLSMLTVLGIGMIFGMDVRYRLGIGMGVLSSLFFSFFSIFSKKIQADTGHTSCTMLFYELIGGAVVLILFTPVYSLVFPEVGVVPTWYDAVYLLVLASVFTIIPFLLQLQALQTVSAFTVNLSYNLEPVYTVFLAMLIFNEARELNGGFWMGISLIVLSVVLQTSRSYYSKHKVIQK